MLFSYQGSFSCFSCRSRRQLPHNITGISLCQHLFSTFFDFFRQTHFVCTLPYFPPQNFRFVRFRPHFLCELPYPPQLFVIFAKKGRHITSSSTLFRKKAAALLRQPIILFSFLFQGPKTGLHPVQTRRSRPRKHCKRHTFSRVHPSLLLQ